MNLANLLSLTLETLLMTILSTLLAYLIGLPVGVILNITSKNGIKPNKYINLVIGTIVNILRSIPCLILVVICMPLTRGVFGRGTGAWYTILIPLFVAAFGFVARMVEQSLSEVPVGELEAVKSLGASSFQLIYKVLLPEARSSLISGIAVSAVSILGYTSFGLPSHNILIKPFHFTAFFLIVIKHFIYLLHVIAGNTIRKNMNGIACLSHIIT